MYCKELDMLLEFHEAQERHTVTIHGALGMVVELTQALSLVRSR